MSMPSSAGPGIQRDENPTWVSGEVPVAGKAGQRPLPLEVGRLFGERFWLEACIGQGGLATIYRARDRQATGDHGLVALKIADTPDLSPQDRITMLAREAVCLQRFRHRALPNLIDAGEAEGWPFLVLPLIIGETLADALRRMAPRGLGTSHALEILEMLAGAVHHIHGLGLVHGDIKTSNILLLPDRGVTLIDFSSTRRRGEIGVGQSGCEPGEAPAMPVSTLFAAPQQFDGLPADPSDDIFALGVLAHVLLTGSHPFGRRDAKEARGLGLPPARSSTALPVPYHQWLAICRALEFSREKRPASVPEFLTGLMRPRPMDHVHEVLAKAARWLG